MVCNLHHRKGTPAKPDIESIPGQRIRAADLGLERFITLDNGESGEYPRFLRISEEKIKMLQRRLAHKLKGSKRCRAIYLSLARLHQHIKRQREDYQNKVIAKLYKENDALIMEKLSIENMLKNHKLAKSMIDSSFGKLIRKAMFKAKMLGKHFITVDPWGTTQFCYNCLNWIPKGLSERGHKCPKCNMKLPRDLNSALLIKRLGIPTIRGHPRTEGCHSLGLSLCHL